MRFAVAFTLAYALHGADLHVAARAGDVAAIAELLAKGADPNSRDGLGGTPLHDATWGGHRKVVELLLSKGANVNARHKEGGSTPLHYAVITDRIEMVELLLARGADPKLRYGQGSTILHLSANRGYVSMSKYLIAQGAELNVRDDAGATPLEEAVWKGRVELVRLLLDNGALADDVNPKSGDGLTHIAARRGHADVLALLIERGADPLKKSKEGATPIDEALRYRQKDTIEVLLKAKSVTASSARIEELVMEGRTDIVAVLLDHGQKADAKTRMGSTLLHDASLKGHTDLVALLLDRGAPANLRNANGATPLHDAALGGKKEVAELLIQRGADINAVDAESGNTALANAAAWGRMDVAALLLAKGADANLANRAGKRPVDLALDNGHQQLAELLDKINLFRCFDRGEMEPNECAQLLAKFRTSIIPICRLDNGNYFFTQIGIGCANDRRIRYFGMCYE